MGKIRKAKLPKRGKKVIKNQRIDIESHKMGKIRKSKFPKIGKKSLKIKEMDIKSENRHESSLVGIGSTIFRREWVDQNRTKN